MDYDLDRFIKAQEKMYDIAFNEIKNGKKLSHWIWYIFPQLKYLGRSDISIYYGIENLDEAKEYLNHFVLGKRLIDICNELLKIDDNIYDVLGGIDSMKLKSSMTLFNLVSDDDIFKRVLDKFFDGVLDENTLNMVNK